MTRSRQRWGTRLRWVAGYAFRSRALIALIIVVTIANSVLVALTPIPLKIIVDNALGGEPLPPLLDSVAPDDDQALIVWAGLTFVIISVASAALASVLSWMWARAGMRSVRELMVDTFDALQRRSRTFHQHRAIGDSVDRIVTDGWVGYGVLQAVLVNPITQTITLAVVVLAAFSLDAPLALAMLVVAPAAAVTARKLGERIKASTDLSRAADGAFAAVVHQVVSLAPLVRSFNASDAVESRYRDHSRTAIAEAERSARSRNLARAIPEIINAAGVGVVVVLGSWRVLTGELGLGVLLAFIAYTNQLRSGVNSLLGTHRTLKAAESSIDRLLEVFESSEVVEDPVSPVVLRGGVQGRVEFDGVWFGYGDEPVLQGVSLSVGVGETVALVGVTGSGKSTLVSLVPRLMDVDSGAVRLDGVDVRELSLEVVRGAVAVVRQEPLLLPLSVAENIAFARAGASMEEVRAAAKAANALEFIEHLPQGFDTVLGERGDTLSGGQKQRLAIARALLKDAPVLVLDEPTSALDAGTELSVIEALERVSQDRTVIIVSHRESALVHADRVVQLADGHLTDTTEARSAVDASLSGYAATSPVPIGHGEVTL